MFKKMLAILSCSLFISGTFALQAFAATFTDTVTVKKSASSDYQKAKNAGKHTYKSINQPNNGDRVQLVSGGWIYNKYYKEQGAPDAGKTVFWESEFEGAHFLKWSSTGTSTLRYEWTLP